ncbi:MAG: hypothetical protein GX638_05920 [Crenarchaeota archaeon]|nr:hypothetical protein [Thermoproteota archaeon]
MNNELVTIEESTLDFDSIKQEAYYPKELDDYLSKCDVWIVPEEIHRDGYDILFPEHTKDVKRFLFCKGMKIDVPCKDDDFHEIELHDASILLGSFLLTSIVLPLFINLISSYIYDKVLSKDKDNEVKLNLHIKSQKGKVVKIKYKGPASKMNSTLKEVEKIANDDKQ